MPPRLGASRVLNNSHCCHFKTSLAPAKIRAFATLRCMMRPTVPSPSSQTKRPATLRGRFRAPKSQSETPNAVTERRAGAIPGPGGRIEVCILAGGLSSRMGCDKSRIHLHGLTLAGHVRRLVRPLRLPVRTIRKDLVPRCGPLGGVHTALATTQADAVLFLSCDMPFISTRLLKDLISRYNRSKTAVFMAGDGWVGFPFLLPRAALAQVEGQLSHSRYALWQLALALEAQAVHGRGNVRRQLFNINTPEDLKFARNRGGRGSRKLDSR